MENGRYQVVKRLACGGMAEVFLARVQGTEGFSKQVALKRIRREHANDQAFVTMFVNEARLSSRLSHPHIVQTLDLGLAGEDLFLAMEYVDGPSLRDMCSLASVKGERLPAPMVLKVISQVCDALAYAHAATDESGKLLKLIHRDVSPDNILLTRTGLAKLTDFGIAKAFNVTTVEKTQTGVIKGKASYLAPELLLSKPFDHRVDLFSLGVVLYECLAGVRPFVATSGGSVEVVIASQAHVPLASRRPDLSPGVVALVDRALAKNPDARFRDAIAFQRALEGELYAMGAPVLPTDIAAVIKRLTYAEPALATPAAPKALPPPPPMPTDARSTTPWLNPDLAMPPVDDASAKPIDLEIEVTFGGNLEVRVLEKNPVTSAPTKVPGRPGSLPPPPVAAGEPEPVPLLVRRVARPTPTRRTVSRWVALAPALLAVGAFAMAGTRAKHAAPPAPIAAAQPAPAPRPLPAPVVAVATNSLVAPPAPTPAVAPTPAAETSSSPKSARKPRSHLRAPPEVGDAYTSNGFLGHVQLRGPAGLRITLDGEPYGTTPVSPLPLTPGIHKVGYSDPQGQLQVIEVSVSPGDLANVNLDPAAP